MDGGAVIECLSSLTASCVFPGGHDRPFYFISSLFQHFILLLFAASLPVCLSPPFFDLSLSGMSLAKLTVISAAYIQHISPFNRFSLAPCGNFAGALAADC